MKNIFLFTALIFSVIITNAQVDLNEGLISHYAFIGNSNDKSPNKNNCNIHGATITADRFDDLSAYYFDGVDDYISANIGKHNNLSVSLWINSENPIQWYPCIVKYSQYQIITMRGNHQNYINGNQVGSIDFGYGLPGTWLPDVIKVNFSEWYHLVFVFDFATSEFKSYVNGIQQASSIPTALLTPDDGNIYFGNTPSGTLSDGGAGFTGKIDDIRIYDRALNNNEVNKLFYGSECVNLISVTDTLVINAVITSFNPLTYSHKIKVYPNPTNDKLNINYGDNYPELSGYTIKILNSLGQIMYSSEISTQMISIDLSNWSGNGLYLLHLIDNKGNSLDVKKIILQ